MGIPMTMASLTLLFFLTLAGLTPDVALADDADAAADAAADPKTRPMSQYNKTQQDKMLQMLEKWRSMVKPKADPTEMETLVWNEELASLAQAQADRCDYEMGYPDWADDLSILSSHPGRRIGFTHWTGWNSSWATNYWNEEGKWFDYCENRCTYDREELKRQGFYRSSVVYYFRGCVNYTQVIWGDSKHVGCGHRVCGFENFHFKPGKDFHICYFFPGAIVEFAESERMKTLPYKTLYPLAVACGADRSFCKGLTTWLALAAAAVAATILTSRQK